MSNVNEEFLASGSAISPNEAEYTILGSLYFDSNLQKKSFILVIDKLEELLLLKNEIKSKISTTYQNDSMNIYSFNGGNISVNQISGGSNSAIYRNEARQKSLKTSNTVYCQTNNGAELYIDGHLNPEFQEYFDEKKRLHEENTMKYDLRDLPTVLAKYQALRKIERSHVFFNNSTNKIDSSLSEQDYRNDLWRFLRDSMKGRVTKEENTFSKDDEESVDLAIVNKDNQITIIEVKFIIQSKFYDDSTKNGYSYYRFGDGYLQLNKYCNHLEKDSQEIYQTYLYMFYAHDRTDKIRDKCQEYYNKVSKGEYNKNNYENFSSFCSAFTTSYRGTILDNLLDSFDYLFLPQ